MSLPRVRFSAALLGALLASGGAAAAQDVERYNIPVAATDPQLGPSTALVTVVTFSEFQCPFCARVQETLRQLRERYGQELRIVFRNNPLPFHQNAMPAAELAMEAYAQQGSQGFWRAHDLLFANQRALERADLERYAAELRLDLGRVRTALEQHTHRPRIDADVALAQRIGARGTPAFFINGRQLMGAQPIDQFVTIIDEERLHAVTLLNRGVSRAELYARIVATGRSEAPAVPTAPQQPRRREDPDTVYRVPVTNLQPALGPRDAPVTLVVFSDFQCPFCARLLPTLRELRATYGNQLRIVWRDNPLPFHERAMPAAILAREAFARRGSDAFWRAHDLLFENQRDLSDATLDRIASEVRVDWRAAQQRGAHHAVIRADMELARQIGATGTPTSFVNGVKLRGAQPRQAFDALITAQLARAREAIQSGRATRSNVYDVLTRDGATAPVMMDADVAPSPTAPSPTVRGEGAIEPPSVYDIAVPTRAPSLGPARAPLVLQWFGDLQCPFTARVLATLTELRRQYPNDVRIVWRDYPLPFHQQAQPAAEAAREVLARHGNDTFWRVVTHLFENQQRFASDAEGLWAVLAEVRGIDIRRVRAAVESGRHRAAVRADMDAVTRAGASIGTPSFFLDGRLLQGAQPIDAFRQLVEDARARRHTRLLNATAVARVPASAARSRAGAPRSRVAAGR
ncbi:MAG: thioredoxin domain-containing protein [Deltaproteobacteria bacterium]|nr:thioredoxin domain-containing protein [Deltaproteobacteria bacterium]